MNAAINRLFAEARICLFSSTSISLVFVADFFRAQKASHPLREQPAKKKETVRLCQRER
jgi:hypothetical protein